MLVSSIVGFSTRGSAVASVQAIKAKSEQNTFRSHSSRPSAHAKSHQDIKQKTNSRLFLLA